MTPRRSTRRGAAYLVALLAGSIVTVTGLAALSMTTSRARTTAMADHAARARTLASTGLEHALCAIAAHLDNGGTRDAITFAAAEPSISMDGGTFGWSMKRLDGSSVSNSDEPIVIRAKAQHGDARFGLHAVLAPSGVPYDTLDTGMYAGGTLELGLLSNLQSDKLAGAVNGITLGLTATGNAPLETAGSVGGLGALLYPGSKSAGVPARRMPDSDLLDYYLALGERISLGSLPMTAGAPTLERLLLSPSSNPFGSTNELGIYIIDCAGGNFIARDVRIVGTLVLLNATGLVTVSGNSLLEPAYDWMPSLLVQGNLTFSGNNSGPSEAGIGVNLNPPHTPYEYVSDATLDDNYPGQIRGVSYVSGNITFSGVRQNFVGTVIAGGNIRIQGGITVHMTYDPGVATLPPYGFFDDVGALAIDPSTIAWRIPD